ncbi:MAG: ABC transporter substrate-binding protein [Deltaproteobacteria bacterium]|nr:ABC transporter substrate-binding protein [Deltaproteobacteria bacterium]
MELKKLMATVGCFLLVFAWVAQPCLGGEPKILKVGGLFCLTGFGSSAETYIAEGAKLSEEWINEQGGIDINGEKYKVELVIEDMKGTADGAVAAATKLVYDHKVNIVIGTVVPFMVQAAGSVLEPAKVLRLVLYNCGMPSEYGPQTPYMFLTYDSTIEGMRAALDYLKEAYPKVKTVAYIIPDDGSVPYLEKMFTEKATSLGYEVAGVAKWAMTTQDYSPIITKVLAAKPDAIAFANGWPQATGSMLKVTREMGFNGPVFGCNYDDAYQIMEIAGKEASTHFFIHQIDLDSPDMTPMIKEITKLTRAKHDKAYGMHIWGFNPLYELKQVIEKAQSTDPAVLKETWEKMETIDTVYGPGRMGGLKTYGINHTVCAPCPIVELMDGKVSWVKWVDVYSE